MPFDASGILAYFLKETGLEVIEAVLDTGGSQMTTVFTADQSWNRIKWPFKIVLIRPGHRPTP
jgi:PIN domain nuclease of toxin-antitoxin system